MSLSLFVVVGCCSSLASIFLLIGAVLAYRSQQRKFEGCYPAKGTVVALERHVVSAGSSGIYCPVVDFETHTGQQVRFVSDFGTRPASHKVGQIVNVLYSPSNPQDAEIDSGLSRWLYTGILAFMGIGALCLGAFFLGFVLLAPVF